MLIIFEEFTVDNRPLGNGDKVLVEIQEATEGVGPNGETGIVGTGNATKLIVSQDVAKSWALDLAIASGMIVDHDKPEVADLAKMRELAKKQHEENKRKGRG